MFFLIRLELLLNHIHLFLQILRLCQCPRLRSLKQTLQLIVLLIYFTLLTHEELELLIILQHLIDAIAQREHFIVFVFIQTSHLLFKRISSGYQNAFDSLTHEVNVLFDRAFILVDAANLSFEQVNHVVNGRL